MLNDVAAILEATAQVTGFDVPTLLGSERTRSVSRSRWAAVYIARADTEASFTELGRVFNRHHATMIHGVKLYSDLLDKKDARAVELVERIRLQAQKLRD